MSWRQKWHPFGGMAHIYYSIIIKKKVIIVEPWQILVIQMLINTWLLRFYYNKTMVNFISIVGVPRCGLYYMQCVSSYVEYLQRICFCLCCEYLQHMCCQTDEDVFFICWCFFYLHVFSEVAACRALLATIPEHYWCEDPI